MMEELNTAYVVQIFFYVLIFIVYAGRLSSLYQDLKKIKKRLHIFKVHPKEKIQVLEQRIKTAKKRYMVLNILSYLFSLVYALSFSTSILADVLYVTLFFVGALLFYMLSNWIKGEGTIDNNPRFRDDIWY